MQTTAVALRSASGTVAGVGVAIGRDGSRVVATVHVEIEERLELELDLIGGLGQSGDDVPLRWGRWLS